MSTYQYTPVSPVVKVIVQNGDIYVVESFNDKYWMIVPLAMPSNAKQVARTDDAINAAIQAIENTCPTCNGTGDNCFDCLGTGKRRPTKEEVDTASERRMDTQAAKIKATIAANPEKYDKIIAKAKAKRNADSNSALGKPPETVSADASQEQKIAVESKPTKTVGEWYDVHFYLGEPVERFKKKHGFKPTVLKINLEDWSPHVANSVEGVRVEKSPDIPRHKIWAGYDPKAAK